MPFEKIKTDHFKWRNLPWFERYFSKTYPQSWKVYSIGQWSMVGFNKLHARLELLQLWSTTIDCWVKRTENFWRNILIFHHQYLMQSKSFKSFNKSLTRFHNHEELGYLTLIMIILISAICHYQRKKLIRIKSGVRRRRHRRLTNIFASEQWQQRFTTIRPTSSGGLSR